MVEGKPEKAEGVSGMLLRHGNSFGIVYATHIPSPGFQRFSVSHELGHYFLPGHVDHILPKGGVHVSRAGFITFDPYELEADHFAAGLLMPEAPFKRAIDQYDPGLDAIEAVADLCQTSRTATAIRFAELTDAAVAVIMSAKSAPVTEASVGLGQYGKVLTVLVSASIGPADAYTWAHSTERAAAC